MLDNKAHIPLCYDAVLRLVFGLMPLSYRDFSLRLPLLFALRASASSAPLRNHLLLLFLLLSPAGESRAQNLEDGARELGRRIVAHVGPMRALVLTVENASTLDKAGLSRARQALESELLSHGMRLVEPAAEGAAAVRVTLSENLRGLLWVAEMPAADEKSGAQVAMVLVERSSGETSRENLLALTIERRLVWEQEAPILDLAPLEIAGGAFLLVLERDQLVLHILPSKGEACCASTSFLLPDDRPRSRDPRGRLILEGELFWAYLPGLLCAGKVEAGERGSGALSVTCKPGNEPWPLHSGSRAIGTATFSARRNFFEGRIAMETGPERRVPPFFAATTVEQQGKLYWIFSGLDGRARLYDERFRPVAELGPWGDELAGIESGCGSGTEASAPGATPPALLLVTKPGEGRDSVQALELAERDASPQAGAVLRLLSPRVDFSGPVTALWTAKEGRAALAVVRNLETQRYEAFHLTIACGR